MTAIYSWGEVTFQDLCWPLPSVFRRCSQEQTGMVSHAPGLLRPLRPGNLVNNRKHGPKNTEEPMPDIPRVRSTGSVARESQASTNFICCKSQSHHRPFLKLVNDCVDYSYLRKLLKFGVRQSTEALVHVHGVGELVCGRMKHCFAD